MANEIDTLEAPSGGRGVISRLSRAERQEAIRDYILDCMHQLVHAMIVKALRGDVAAAKLLFDRVLPALPPSTHPPLSVTGTKEDILKRVIDGDMRPEVAEAVLALLPREEGKEQGPSKEALRRIIKDLYGTDNAD